MGNTNTTRNICRHLPQMERRKKRNPRPAEKQTLPRPVEIDKTRGAKLIEDSSWNPFSLCPQFMFFEKERIRKAFHLTLYCLWFIFFSKVRGFNVHLRCSSTINILITIYALLSNFWIRIFLPFPALWMSILAPTRPAGKYSALVSYGQVDWKILILLRLP